MVLMLGFHSTLFKDCRLYMQHIYFESEHTNTQTHTRNLNHVCTFFCILIKWYYCVYSIKRISAHNTTSVVHFVCCWCWFADADCWRCCSYTGCCYHRQQHHQQHHCFSLLFILCFGTLRLYAREWDGLRMQWITVWTASVQNKNVQMCTDTNTHTHTHTCTRALGPVDRMKEATTQRSTHNNTKIKIK